MLALSQRLSTRPALLVLLLLYVLFPAFLLPNAEAQLKAYSGGFGPIDLLFTYTPETVFQMVAAYGAEGRAFYRTLEMTLDIAYPVVYTLFFSGLLMAVLRRAVPTHTFVHRLALLPFLVFVIDMAENIGIITMLSQYPTQSVWVAQLTSLFTTAKWVCFGTIILTLLVGLGLMLIGRLTNRNQARIA